MSALAIALLMGAAIGAEAPAKPIYGSVTAIDGDTLRMGDSRIRLFGIDAPELDQSCFRSGANWACGAEAASKLSSLTRGKTVRCIPTGHDDFGRVLARCDTIGVELNEAMVASGYAVALRKYSNDYKGAEAIAKARQTGIWAGTFMPPSEYRAKQHVRRSPARVSARSVRNAPARGWASRGGCAIKGNRSRRGEWIYHLPGMPYYEQTRPEEIFCSEAEARAAGYRRALVR